MGDSIYAWSTTASENATADDEINWAEGQLPGTVNNSARALMRRVAQFISDNNGTLSTTNTVNAFSITSAADPDALTDGFLAVVRFNAAPTGAATLQVNSLLAKDLKTLDGAAITANMIDSGDVHTVVYNTTAGEYRLLTLDSRQLTDHAIGATVQAYDANLDATEEAFLTAHLTKLGYLTVTQAVDLDTIEARIAALDQAVILVGDFSPSGGVFPGGGTAQAGAKYVADDTGTIDSVEFKAGDTLIAVTDNAATDTYASNWVKIDNTENAATETVTGIVELATTAEVVTGTDVVRAVTAAGVQAFWDDKAADQSVWNTGTGTDEQTISPAKLKAAVEQHESAGYTTFVIAGTIEGAQNIVVLDQMAKFTYDVENISVRCSAGDHDLALEINNVAITSMGNIQVGTTENTVTATGANSVGLGDTLQIDFESDFDDDELLYFTVECTRTG